MLVFVFTGKAHGDAFRRLRHLCLQSAQQFIHPLPGGHIGFDGNGTLAVYPHNGSGLVARLQGHKFGQRHLAPRRVDGLALQLLQLTPVVGHPHGNVHFVPYVFRPVGGQYQAVGYQAHGAANTQHIGTKAGGGLPVYLQAPLNAGQAAVVFNVDKATLGPHLLLYLVHIAIQVAAVHAADQ